MKDKVTSLDEKYAMSQQEVADKMFICKNTVMNVEKRALDKIRKLLAERSIKAEDLLER